MSKENTRKITIIIPCLNAAKTISKTLNSLRDQTDKNFECIVMDGKSNDGTQDIVKEYSDIVDIFISEKDDSGADSCNKAIKMASGELIMFLYADDFLVSSSIYDIISAYNKNNSIDFISYGLQVQDLHSEKIILKSFLKRNISLSIKNACFKHVLNHAYKKKLFDEIGYLRHLYFDNKIFFSNDREFLIRLCINEKKNYVIEKILYIMQSHENSFTGSRSNIARIRYEHIGIAEHYLSKSNLSVENKKTLILFKSHNLALLFIWYFLTLNMKNSFKVFLMGLKYCRFKWIYLIFSRPIVELIYRLSVVKLF